MKFVMMLIALALVVFLNKTALQAQQQYEKSKKQTAFHTKQA